MQCWNGNWGEMMSCMHTIDCYMCRTLQLKGVQHVATYQAKHSCQHQLLCTYNAMHRRIKGISSTTNVTHESTLKAYHILEGEIATDIYISIVCMYMYS